MSDAKITLIGLYNYRPDIFDNCVFPAGIDRNIAINTILANNAEFEPLYWDADYMKLLISNWSAKWQWTFDKWYKAININYDPLNNYDRHEEYQDDRTGSDTNNIKTDGTSKDTGTADNETKVSAYNSSTYQPKEKNTLTNNLTNTIDNSTTSNGSNKEHIEHKAHLWGNIGVTTSQMMLSAELDIAQWNLYNQISDLFKTELLITVY